MAEAMTIPKSTKAQRATMTKVDTILVTPALIESWETPPFQRPLRANNKVMALAESIKETKVIPGVITLGVLDGRTYRLDGQHRCHAFLLAGVAEGYADVRTHWFETMGDMGEEFVQLNSSLVRLRPDDILRGLEGTYEVLRIIRKRCPFVGYDHIRRGPGSPIVSMSSVIRTWGSALCETPGAGGQVGSAQAALAGTTEAQAAECAEFLTLCFRAWGLDVEYQRLWGALNLTLCGWLYVRLVLRPQPGRVKPIDAETFTKCLMALSADPDYLNYLVGRTLGDRDRSPAFSRIKKIFGARLLQTTGRKAVLPAPEWAHGRVV